MREACDKVRESKEGGSGSAGACIGPGGADIERCFCWNGFRRCCGCWV
jgi:hypothetical protein